MEITIGKNVYSVNENEVGGVLTFLTDENIGSVALPWLDSHHFNIFLNASRCDTLTTKEIVEAFKIAHYLNSSSKMELFGKALAKILENCTYNGIREISMYFL